MNFTELVSNVDKFEKYLSFSDAVIDKISSMMDKCTKVIRSNPKVAMIIIIVIIGALIYSLTVNEMEKES